MNVQAGVPRELWANPVKSILGQTKSRRPGGLAKKADQIQVVLRGKCYVGQGTAVPAGGGDLKCCFGSTANPGGSSDCSNWDQVFQTATVSGTGDLNGWFYQYTGSYFIAVYFPPYAVQWWDGSNLNGQPSLVEIDKDTIDCEFHFQPGCQIGGKVTVPPAALHYSQEISLLDTCGLTILSTFCDTSGHFNLTCVPVGSYYLYAADWNYVNCFYPDNKYASDAQRIKLDTAGQVVENISWTLHARNDTAAVRSSYLTVEKNDTSMGVAAALRYLGSTEMSFSSISGGDSLFFNVNPGDPFFLARVNNMYSPLNMSVSYFPGTFLRSGADTLRLAPSESLTVFAPIASGGQITGALPVFGNGDLEYQPILSRENSYKTIGGEPYVDSFGHFQMWAPEGHYSLWFVPFTTGYHRAFGWGAIGNTASVVSGQVSQLSNMGPVLQRASILGTIRCGKDPLVACFDSLGRCISMTEIPLYNYLQNLTGYRWMCFDFNQIYAPPYNVRFAINCLPPGRYALALADPTDSSAPNARITWYGGDTYFKPVVEPDDVASLDVPKDAAWVTITSPDETVELSDFSAGIQNGEKRDVRDDRLLSCHMSSNFLVLNFRTPPRNVAVKLFTLSGRIALAKVFPNPGNTVKCDISGLASSQLVICLIRFDGSCFTRRMVVAERR
jgi:hypothetical protein